jgi:hypothetical protein
LRFIREVVVAAITTTEAVDGFSDNLGAFLGRIDGEVFWPDAEDLFVFLVLFGFADFAYVQCRRTGGVWVVARNFWVETDKSVSQFCVEIGDGFRGDFVAFELLPEAVDGLDVVGLRVLLELREGVTTAEDVDADGVMVPRREEVHDLVVEYLPELDERLGASYLVPYRTSLLPSGPCRPMRT